RALALTDTDNLYGLWPFLKACRENEVRPIVGAQITDTASRRLVVCLAKDAEGYANLCEIITARKMGDETSRRVPIEFYAGDLAGGTGTPARGASIGRANSLHRKQLRPPGATRTGLHSHLLKMRDVKNTEHRFALSGFLSAPPMNCFSFAGNDKKENSREQSFDIARAVEERGKGLCVLTDDAQLLERWHSAGLDVSAAVRGLTESSASVRAAAKRLGVPVAAVPDSFFLSPGGHRFHTLLCAIALNTTFSRLTANDAAPASAYLAAPEEYEKRFAILPEAVRATHEIAERCAFAGPDTSVIFPPWEGDDACATLRALAYEGARNRYGNISDAVKNRLECELGIIAQKGFCAYFLVVRDIVLRSPRICGRGSGAASLVAYSLGITNVCPMKHNLYFERFLNPGRTDPPDIDVDFAWDERAEVIASVLKQYAGHSAMVSNHVFFQPRMAIRETAKVYGLSAREIAEVAEKVPWFMDAGDGGLQAALERVPRARFLEFGPPWPEILKLAGRLIGTPRNLSVHPGGVVITPGPIARHVPLELKLDGVPVIQWEKDGAEMAGLVKIDLLGNRSLGVIRDAIRNVRENGAPFDEAAWEPED
ncbi:MAG: PHP domain-containing protein, partial [Desulfatitalea sp.]|nr:PHP domain-containing protein [Desulfatitalea sp.]